jgi:hypothetical protein
MSTVAALWSAAYQRLALEYLDIETRLPSVEQCPSVARVQAAAGREAGRIQRGAGDLAELGRRLQTWEAEVLAAIAGQDSARSERLCIDCGAADVPTIQPGLTGGRICRRCLRESTPTFPRFSEGRAHHG